MNQNRRRHLRKVPEKFGFVQIEGDEVGRVLNVSEGGLSFSSFTPVPQDGPLYFWFSFNLNERIEAMGEVAWTNGTRKVGGLQFTHLPRESRRQIRTWLSRLPTQQIPDEETVPQVVQMGERTRSRMGEPDRVARFVSKARARDFPAGAETVKLTDVSFPSHNVPLSLSTGIRESPDVRPKLFPASAKAISRDDLSAPLPTLQRAARPLVHPAFSLNLNRADEVLNPPAGIDVSGGLVPVERYNSAKKRQLIVGVLLGVCVSVGAIWAAHKYSNYLHQSESATTAPAESSVAKNDALATRPARQPEFVPSSPGADIFSGSPPIRSVVSKPTAGKRGAMSNSYAPSHSQALRTKVSKPSEGTNGQPSSSGTSSSGKRQMTPRQLWNAVQAGNSNAAVTLAELYIKGEGVSQNCQQARVLLLMASEKRNPAAIKRLQELDKDKTTCP